MTDSISVSTRPLAIELEGRSQRALELTVSSLLPMDRDLAWRNVRTPALLEFIARGMIRFDPAEPFPPAWEAGQTYRTRMRLFGFLPAGGMHHLRVESIDEGSGTIQTREWDALVSVWEHRIALRELDAGIVRYEDRIVIHAGMLTGLVTLFAKIFYRHRQRRWQIVAKYGLDFSAEHHRG